MLLPIRQIIQEMAVEKLRLGLTIIAVAWATLCITTMLAVGEGIRLGVLKTAQNGNGNLIYLTGGMATLDHGSFYKGKSLTLGLQDVGVLKALPIVQGVSPTASWNERVTVGNRSSWQDTHAVYTDFALLTKLKTMSGGRWLNSIDEHYRRKVIVLGYSLAADLFNPPTEFDWLQSVKLKGDPVGRKVKIGTEEFIVIGVLEKSSAEIEQGEQVNYTSFVPFSTWQRFHSKGNIDAINVEPRANTDRHKLADAIRQVIARKHGASVSDEQVVQIEDMFLKQKSMGQFLIGIQGFLGIIGLVTLAVAAVGVANVMYATVRRAKCDIGVRMAVGATPTAIRLHYLLQSLITMILGGIFGLVATYILVSTALVIDLEGNSMYEHFGKPVPQVSWLVVGVVTTTLGCIGVISAWVPANQASKVSPLEALQSE